MIKKRGSTLALNRPYLALIQRSVQKDGVYFEEITENYLYKAHFKDKAFIMHDVEIGLNNSSSAKIAISKSGTYEALCHSNIPAVQHLFLMNSNSRFNKIDPLQLATNLFYEWDETVVLKQDNGSQGNNVYKITSQSQLEECMQKLFQLNVHGAISPYKEALNEYRVVMLNGHPKLLLGKQRTTSWKHNLINGARSFDVPPENIPLLSGIAQMAATALQLRFCTVDILETREGLLVLEINEQVMLDEYCKQHPERQKKVEEIYREAILLRFALI